jgi:hypothetical protein
VATEFAIGWAGTDRAHTAIAGLPPCAWSEAIDIDGVPRDSAAVAELTGVLPAGALDDYPPGTRIIVRRERPHPGAQMDLIEDATVALHLLRHRYPDRSARLARRPAPLPRQSGRPHPLRQGHRPGPVPGTSRSTRPG